MNSRAEQGSRLRRAAPSYRQLAQPPVFSAKTAGSFWPAKRSRAVAALPPGAHRRDYTIVRNHLGRKALLFCRLRPFRAGGGRYPHPQFTGRQYHSNEIGPKLRHRAFGAEAMGARSGDLFDVAPPPYPGSSRCSSGLQQQRLISLLNFAPLFPAFLYASYRTFPESGSFLHYHINHPAARRVIGSICAPVPMIKDCPTFDICRPTGYTSFKNRL